jgi:dihydroorotase
MSETPTVLIRGGALADGTRTDVLVQDGLVVDLDGALDAPSGATVLDADGCVVGPGLVDLHSHLRQPGQEEAETIETGSRGAALGGFTAVVAMPNTIPALDSAGVVREVQDLARTALCDVQPSGAITVGRKGEILAPMAELAELGVRLFTDDGAGVQDNRLMRRAMEYASGLRSTGTPVVLAQHCEDDALCGGGHMNEGEWSSRLGIPGQPAEAEELMVMRDIALCRLTGARIHFQHLSTAGSVGLVAEAKAAGLPVTAEATTHHFTLTDAECATYDPVFKVNPPLRTAKDVDAVRGGLADGTIDAIATDHAPHTQEAKEQPFEEAPPGMLGLETALALAHTELVLNGVLDLASAFALLSARPAGVVGLDTDHGSLAVGRTANVIVFDPSETWTVDPGSFASRSRNSPYAGRRLTGKVRHTVHRGEPVVIDAQATR